MKRDTEGFSFTIEHQEPLYRGFYQMDQLTIRHQRFDGGQLTINRELMDRADAVCVLLVDLPQKKAVFIEQFRVGALRDGNPWLIELVAGLIDKDEQPEQVAKREAFEETGLELGRLRKIMEYLPSPGGTNERIHLYVGEVDSAKASGLHGLEEEGEDIRVFTTSLQEAYEMINDGSIRNAASIIALQWLQLHESTLKDEWA
ncbi:NUDIX domain-containing protein [Reinekea sp. G2M2-21]|uniref:NUDIX domain-containing protein n=1 Tax=Reinekea sp. G2M2-21 TaxID=2788942 RepID=UPI0018AB41C0|nr:NUDIX domain-containing protein [Reinekea sp. G2M2-21]